MSPPDAQGVDGYVVPIPAGLADGAHTITVKGRPAVAGSPYDLSAQFYTKDCEHMHGPDVTAGADASGTIPAKAAYAVVTLITGANVRFHATTAKK